MKSSAIEVQMEASGKLLIPQELLQRMGLSAGGLLLVRVEDGRLIIEKAETVKQRLKQRFVHLRGQGIVEDLIAERRAAAAREDR